MPRKRHSAEEIVAKLRQADVLLAQGQTGADVARVLGVTETNCVMSCSTRDLLLIARSGYRPPALEVIQPRNQAVALRPPTN